jgi:hypothetical protein
MKPLPVLTPITEPVRHIHSQLWSLNKTYAALLHKDATTHISADEYLEMRALQRLIELKEKELHPSL